MDFGFAFVHTAFPLAFIALQPLLFPFLGRHWLQERGAGIELRAADHQRHHVQGSVNFSKRFSLFDRLFGTWADGPRPRGLKVIDPAEAPADAYPVD